MAHLPLCWRKRYSWNMKIDTMPKLPTQIFEREALNLVNWKAEWRTELFFVVVLHWSSHKVALSLYSSICQLFYFLKFWEIPSSTPFKGIFCNQWTLSLLAGLCDIYNAYGNLVNVVHMFRLFPHQRYEKFLSELAKMRQISDHITESNCSNKTCPLKYYHGAKKSLESGDWTNSSCWCLSNKRCWNEHRN